MRNVTLALTALALLATTPEVVAQCTGVAGQDFFQVTAREINAIPQTNIDDLNAESAAGTLDIARIQELLTNDLEGEIVEFRAVFLTDPLLSGLASLNAEGIPGRIHVFARDVNAVTEGVEGMTIQIVDGSGSGDILAFEKEEEVIICGQVAPFEGGGKAMQISPVSINSVSPTVTPSANPEFYEPTVISVDDIHDEVNGETQIDWDAYSDFNGQYVRFEAATLVQGVNDGARPNLLFSSNVDGNQPQINQYDTSVCYRNDRDESYFPPGLVPACIDDDFVAPATGTVNVQGFLTFQGDDGGFGYSGPGSANFVISPFEEEDFQIAAAPPIVTVDGVGFIPSPSDDVTVSAEAVANDGTITSVEAAYDYIVDGMTVSSGSVMLMNTSGDTYEGTIPAGQNGALVVYTITVEDSEGGSTSVTNGYRILDGAVTSIALVQETFPGGDNSLLYTAANGDGTADDPIPFDLDAVVQQVFQRGDFWFGSLQDDADLAPWTGTWVFFGPEEPTLMVGDRINITEAAINESFDVTQLQDLTFTVSSSGAPYDYKVVPTGVLNDPTTAEAHEGMLLRFENVTITDNDTGFGEWAFSSTGNAADAQEADDWADAFDEFDPALFFANGEVREFIQGLWWFSFGEYKLAPILLEDIGDIGTVAVETGIEGRTIRIVGTAPNPTSATAQVAFELDAPGAAALRVFDMTGREVSVLAEGDFAAGPHAAAFRADALAPGVYVVRLEANGEIATARLAVVR
ncbi:MAG: T9SS type A sorting domain-containing protein [Bacteroidota bacterium]